MMPKPEEIRVTIELLDAKGATFAQDVVLLEPDEPLIGEVEGALDALLTEYAPEREEE